MKLLESIKKDFLELLPPTIFFFVAFALILTTKRMILSEYQISWTGFGTAVVGAILAGKVVLMVDKLPFVNRFPDRPLIFNTLWKSLLYFLAALVVCYLDQLVHFLRKQRRPHGSQPASVGGSGLAPLLAFADVAGRALPDLLRHAGTDPHSRQRKIYPPVFRRSKTMNKYGIEK